MLHQSCSISILTVNPSITTVCGGISRQLPHHSQQFHLDHAPLPCHKEKGQRALLKSEHPDTLFLLCQQSCYPLDEWKQVGWSKITCSSQIPLMTHCFPDNYKQLGGPSISVEKAEPGGIKCHYMKPKSLQGQVISRFKKALQETAVSDVYGSCSLSDGRSGTRRPQEPGEETDTEHHKL